VPIEEEEGEEDMRRVVNLTHVSTFFSLLQRGNQQKIKIH
jgi:hypothetical protein